MKGIVAFSVFLILVLPNDLDAKLARQSRRQQDEEEDIWNWSVTPEEHVTKPPRHVTQAPFNWPNVAKESDPCSRKFNPPIPDFSAPGRRLSEVKCYEYIFDIRVRDQIHRDAACMEYAKKEGTNEESEYPHMAAIGWPTVDGGWIFQCGGTLISDRFVLTAAYCARAPPGDTRLADTVPKIVRLGDKSILNNPTTVNIKRIIKHEQFKPPKKYFDIALIELETPVAFSDFIQPACLGNGKSLAGVKATLSGWGVVDTASATKSPELKEAVVEIFNASLCNRLLTPSCTRRWCGMKDHQLCAAELAGDVNACRGDSGSPLQLRMPLPPTTKGRMYRVVGVTSFGISCSMPHLPAIYTRVDRFLDWIEDHVWKSSP